MRIPGTQPLWFRHACRLPPQAQPASSLSGRAAPAGTRDETIRNINHLNNDNINFVPINLHKSKAALGDLTLFIKKPFLLAQLSRTTCERQKRYLEDFQEYERCRNVFHGHQTEIMSIPSQKID